MYQNLLHHNYFSTSRTGDINLFGKILQYNLLAEEKDFPQINQQVAYYRKINGEANPWEFVKFYPDYYWDDANEKGILEAFYNYLFVFYSFIQNIWLITFPAIFFSLYRFYKERSLLSATMLIIGAISLYQIIFAAFFSFAEYGRLIAPAQPQLYLFSFYNLFLFFQYISTLYKQKNQEIEYLL